MLHPAHYVIRPATIDDADAISRLAALDSARAPEAPLIIGELGGAPAAALSLADGRSVSNPFERTSQLMSYMRIRARALKAVDTEPSLRRRMLLAVPTRLRPAQAA